MILRILEGIIGPSESEYVVLSARVWTLHTTPLLIRSTARKHPPTSPGILRGTTLLFLCEPTVSSLSVYLPYHQG